MKAFFIASVGISFLRNTKPFFRRGKKEAKGKDLWQLKTTKMNCNGTVYD